MRRILIAAFLSIAVPAFAQQPTVDQVVQMRVGQITTAAADLASAVTQLTAERNTLNQRVATLEAENKKLKDDAAKAGPPKAKPAK